MNVEASAILICFDLCIQASQAQITLTEHASDAEDINRAVSVQESVISALYDEQRKGYADGIAAKSQELSEAGADMLLQQAEDDMVSDFLSIVVLLMRYYVLCTPSST